MSVLAISDASIAISTPFVGDYVFTGRSRSGGHGSLLGEGEKMTLEYYPATSLARFFSDEGVGSAVDCAPQRKKVSIRSGVRIPVEQCAQHKSLACCIAYLKGPGKRNSEQLKAPPAFGTTIRSSKALQPKGRSAHITP
ncbi:hypothetical protein TIFTF001_052779 [Ficus carica]|uniref:Uncharacterized protein n=1 Tax=Ficus carica TaxID=3494 RepID=A0AA88EFD3_FICCA|nr:hypothetical protein TIFTF001_052779 [Ficus carica]